MGSTEVIKLLMIEIVSNYIRNTKYTILSFLPFALYRQFKVFFNLFYLLVGLAQLIPQLKVSPVITNLAPLCFVVSITLIKEARDDYKRFENVKHYIYENLYKIDKKQFNYYINYMKHLLI